MTFVAVLKSFHAKITISGNFVLNAKNLIVCSDYPGSIKHSVHKIQFFVNCQHWKNCHFCHFYVQIRNNCLVCVCDIGILAQNY